MVVVVVVVYTTFGQNVPLIVALPIHCIYVFFYIVDHPHVNINSSTLFLVVTCRGHVDVSTTRRKNAW